MSVIVPSNPAAPLLAGPTPPAERLPFFRYLRTVRRNFIEALDESMYEAPIIEQRSAVSRSFIVNDPAGVRRVLLENAANYPKAPVEHRILGPAMGNGLILSEGETWRAHRRIMAPAFDHRTNERYAPVMVDAARKLAEQWAALPPGATVEVQDAMMEMTLDIISRSMFAADSDSIVAIIREGSDRYQDVMMVGLLEFVPGIGRLWSAWKGVRGRAIMREFDRAMFRLIEARMQPGANANHDLLDRLIESRDDESGAGMNAREIRDQVLTIFVAGHETTALALTWTWYVLSMHPEHEARMHAELEEVLGGREPGMGGCGQADLDPDDSAGVDAAISGGAHTGVSDGAGGRRGMRHADSEGIAGHDHSVDHPSSPESLGESRPLRAGAVYARGRRATRQACLSTVRVRAADLYRRVIRNDRGGADSGHAGSALQNACSAGMPRGAACDVYAAGEERNADDRGSARLESDLKAGAVEDWVCGDACYVSSVNALVRGARFAGIASNVPSFEKLNRARGGLGYLNIEMKELARIDEERAGANWRRAWAAYTDRRVLQVLALGFSSGLPLLLTYSTLSAWLATRRAARGHWHVRAGGYHRTHSCFGGRRSSIAYRRQCLWGGGAVGASPSRCF